MRRHASFFALYARALAHRHVELTVALALVGLVILVSALVMHRIEAPAGTFISFWHALYWAAITVTTVGYGDVVPLTPAGQAVTAVVSIFGAGLMLLLAGMLAAIFLNEMRRVEDETSLCPYCGRGSDGSEENH